MRPIRRQYTYSAVESAIKEYILQQELQPGDALPSERELSQTLGVSRPTVREGLRSLAMMGLVEVRTGEGTFVRSIDLGKQIKDLSPLLLSDNQNILDLQEVREALEVMAAGRAALHITDEQLAAMEVNLAAYAEVLERGEYDVDLDVAFHNLIYSAAQNKFLQQLADSITDLVHIIRVTGLQSLSRPLESVYQHRDIFHALKARDPMAATSAMRVHMQQVRTNLSNTFRA